MGEYYQKRLNLTSLDHEFAVEITTREQNKSFMKRYIFEPIALIKSSSLFKLTYFRDMRQDSIISFPTLLNLTEGQYQSVNDIPLKHMVFKFTDGISDAEIDSVIA